MKKQPIAYRVTVKGQGRFPVDMLRYDAAYPYQERDSAIIDQHDQAIRSVVVVTQRPPTDGRWASFGWKIEKVEEVR